MHHYNTILSQILKMFSRYEFQKAVSETNAEYHSRGFSFWNHFVAMLFGQLAGQDSLYSIEAGLAIQGTVLNMPVSNQFTAQRLPMRTNTAPTSSFKNFFLMLSKCEAIAPQHKFRFKNSLYSLDATVIDLCLSLYNWRKFRTTKGAVKLHMKLNHSEYLPAFAVITTGKVHESQIASSIPLERGMWLYSTEVIPLSSGIKARR